MGCDIHSYVEVKNSAGDWELRPFKGDEDSDEPFGWRCYSVFAFIADVRNYASIAPLSVPRGLPDDVSKEVQDTSNEWEGDGHSHSWLMLEELIAVDYEQQIECRRHNGATLEKGHGQERTLREFLGGSYFYDLEILKSYGDADKVRIVFFFDN